MPWKRSSRKSHCPSAPLLRRVCLNSRRLPPNCPNGSIKERKWKERLSDGWQGHVPPRPILSEVIGDAVERVPTRLTMELAAGSLLEIRDLAKNFPGVKALQGVDFTVRRGEVHALMGENGAGKSTLIKVLTGVYPRNGGTVRLDGTEIHARSPKEAEAAGISTVYQEVNLIPHLSVAENICLGRQPTRLGLVRWGAMAERARNALARVDLKIDVSQPLSSYSIALQQLIAIARALDISAKLLILDEPTSSLDEKEVAELFNVIRKLRATGMGVVIVTHFIEQVYA